MFLLKILENIIRAKDHLHLL